MKNTAILFAMVYPVDSFSPLRQENQPSRVALYETTPCASVDKEWDVDRYQLQHSFVYKYGANLVEFADLQPDEKNVLDVGCGSGELTQALATVHGGTNVVGVDADGNMVSKAQAQYPDLKFVEADMRFIDPTTILASNGELFDVIFSNAALHWVPPANISHTLVGLAALLKPGGRFVVEFGGEGNVKHICDAFRDATGFCPRDVWYFPSIAHFASELQKVGIEVTYASLFDRPTVLEEGELGLRNWVKMFASSFLEDHTHLEKTLEKVEDACRQNLWDGESWKADYRRIRIVGTKRSD